MGYQFIHQVHSYPLPASEGGIQTSDREAHGIRFGAWGGQGHALLEGWTGTLQVMGSGQGAEALQGDNDPPLLWEQAGGMGLERGNRMR